MHRQTYELLLFRINNALTEMRVGNNPGEQDWCEIASMVNTLHALRLQGKIEDPDELIADALAAMRAAQGKYRFTGKGLQTIILLLQDYTATCEQLPERTMKSAINFAFDQQLKERPR